MTTAPAANRPTGRIPSHQRHQQPEQQDEHHGQAELLDGGRRDQEEQGQGCDRRDLLQRFAWQHVG